MCFHLCFFFGSSCLAYRLLIGVSVETAETTRQCLHFILRQRWKDNTELLSNSVCNVMFAAFVDMILNLKISGMMESPFYKRLCVFHHVITANVDVLHASSYSSQVIFLSNLLSRVVRIKKFFVLH